jgi:adenine-specific DNA-methyltransferase
MPPEKVQMSEQPTDKPEVMPRREPGRPFEITRTELVWPGKYDEKGNLVEPPRISLPFQVIEVIEEGRTSREGLKQAMLPLFGEKPKVPAEDGWRNKLIWGDNLLVMGSLLKDFAGKIDLIYIDPPFATGIDFSVTTEIGQDGDEVTKAQSTIEEKVYRDTWSKGIDSYLSMMFPRLAIMRDLLSPSGSIFVHCDWHASAQIRMLLDEIFGTACFRNEIIWYYRRWTAPSRFFQRYHDNLLWYSKQDFGYLFHEQWEEPTNVLKGRKESYERDEDGRLFRWQSLHGERYKIFRDDRGVRMGDVWELAFIHPSGKERTGYATQKPESLLERVVASCSEPGGVIADLFCGSGTTLAVAEKLGRRWIGCDLGRFAIHTTRKRLLDLRVKDSETGEERGCRPFEVLNLGRYERKYWQGITFGNEPKSDEETSLAAYVKFILDLYKAQPVNGTHIHGKKGGAFVHVGAVDAPVTISQIEDAAAEAQRLGGKELHILGWEFEMGLHDPITQYVRAQHGVVVRLVSIPRETMERRAVEAGDVRFFDLAYIEVSVKPEKGGIKVALKDFVIPSTDLIPEKIRAKIKKWSDYIDYWAVDWDFRNDTFVNQWQTYRTRQDRSLALETPVHTYDKPGSYQILVKVVDIFGNDTSHLVKWEVQ